ncbi:MAG: hypothetical protein ACRCY8_16380 [Dermatophilaceae bacterium]
MYRTRRPLPARLGAPRRAGGGLGRGAEASSADDGAVALTREAPERAWLEHRRARVAAWPG